MAEYVYSARPVTTGATRLSFTPREWTRLAGLYGFIAILHILGWGLYLHYATTYPAIVGLGFVAYMFGVRHAFDADHIAAIDDTVRYMLQKGRNLSASASSFPSAIRRSFSVLPWLSPSPPRP